ncbi:nucleolar protein, putative [Entamoeba invadens IP1]|uniref:nucleolar protein, putative n=1 Tax=Entamoeba invadens IP1 TaxID=370355 RepID=UPI0002C3F0AB|nr:nucleolar protein, putative [Entamoeba invadens IP1]ELP85072.1 nucleolar protein, putative [Entamoeba invadens IP1]|eukprot:XP_004184418.1 nucleolar protein, putative [Entamoeba invadens IP1]
MKSTEISGVKVYNLTAGKTLPQWLTEKQRRQLRKDEDFKKRIELIQDTEFTVSSRCIKFSPDNQYLAASGMYPPLIKMFELDQLSEKFERRLDAEVIKFDFLEDDYSKLMYMLSDNTMEFHNKGGIQCKIKTPKTGRDFTYFPSDCNVYMATNDKIDVLNLYEGKFNDSIDIEMPINCFEKSEKYQIIFCGEEEGSVSVLDPRVGNFVSRTQVSNHLVNHLDVNGGQVSKVEVTSMAYDGNLQLLVGTSNGNILTYDIRSQNPLLSSYHQNRMPIVKCMYHTTQNGEFSVTADASIVRFCKKSDGKLVLPLEGSKRSVITDLAIANNSGLCVMAGDFTKLQVFYVPMLGIAPKWCSFLENLTEELEEEEGHTYDDFQFVTKKELADLGLESLYGSQYLKPYMHGYFIHIKLYQRAVALKFV